MPDRRLTWRHFAPLVLGFLLPSVVIGYGFVLPRNGQGFTDELSIGFLTTLLGAAITYVAGVRMASRG
jgi:hypothetical protein